MAASLAVAVAQTSAQDKYSTRPITIIVPQAAAGANDTVARFVGQKLSEQLGPPLIVEMLQNRTGIRLAHVPYRGAAPAVQNVVGGQMPISVQSLPSSLAFIRSGRLKVLAVTNEKRVAMLPDVPTAGEPIKGFGATPWYALFAPADTPPTVIARLQLAVAKVLASQDLRDKFAEQRCEAFAGTPQKLSTLIRDELPRWATVKIAGATVD
jgi:tripartite-type tricarboxylate transporter receptor subunit TctC